MASTRFILEELAARKLGYSLPFYLPGQVDKTGGVVAKVQGATDIQLLQVVAQASQTPLPTINQPTAIARQVLPLRLKAEGGQWWELPIEPIVSVKSKNIITRKTVARGKGRGTVKEYFAQDDYEIAVSGILVGGDFTTYPFDDVQRLRAICENGGAIEVQSDFLRLFDIYNVCIEGFDFPFTKGENIQGYTFTAYSDDINQVLILEQ